MNRVAPIARLDHPGLLPAALLPPEDPGSGVRRSVRDWVVDCGLFAGSALIGLVVLDQALSGAATRVPDDVQALDLLLGSLACLSLWWRRRWPVPVALLTSVLTAFSAFAAIANLVAVFTAAVHRRVSLVLVPAAGSFGAGLVYAWWVPATDTLATTVTVDTVVVAIAVTLGMAVRARRQLVWSLRERAERAESEQQLRAEQARTAERARIAREMHDVLAHRISLLALHAGGLEVQPNLSPTVHETAVLLRTTARQALEELRDVIGVLRSTDGTGGSDVPRRPQPGLSDVPRLVDEHRAAGVKIECAIAVADGIPATPARDAYRIVQEALTNAAKHAPGTAVTVDITGGPGDGLAVRVCNPLPVTTPARTLPGSGTGLIGLTERATLAHGTLAHGVRGDRFVVEAHLPWG